MINIVPNDPFEKLDTSTLIEIFDAVVHTVAEGGALVALRNGQIVLVGIDEEVPIDAYDVRIHEVLNI